MPEATPSIDAPPMVMRLPSGRASTTRPSSTTTSAPGGIDRVPPGRAPPPGAPGSISTSTPAPGPPSGASVRDGGSAALFHGAVTGDAGRVKRQTPSATVATVTNDVVARAGPSSRSSTPPAAMATTAPSTRSSGVGSSAAPRRPAPVTPSATRPQATATMTARRTRSASVRWSGIPVQKVLMAAGHPGDAAPGTTRFGWTRLAA